MKFEGKCVELFLTFSEMFWKMLTEKHTDFSSGYTNSHLHQQWLSIPLSLYPTAFVSLMIDVLAEVRWNFTVTLTCISPVTNDVGQLIKVH